MSGRLYCLASTESKSSPTSAAEDPAVHGAPLGGRDLLQARDSVQEADPAVDQHALEAQDCAGPAAGARHGKTGGAQRGLDCEKVSGQSRELLYSTPTALCEEIASASLRSG